MPIISNTDTVHMFAVAGLRRAPSEHLMNIGQALVRLVAISELAISFRGFSVQVERDDGWPTNPPKRRAIGGIMMLRTSPRPDPTGACSGPRPVSPFGASPSARPASVSADPCAPAGFEAAHVSRCARGSVGYARTTHRINHIPVSETLRQVGRRQEAVAVGNSSLSAAGRSSGDLL